MQANNILSAIEASDRAELTNAGHHITFGHGDVLGQRDEAIDHVFFPVSGMVSVVVELEDGECVETAMLGHRGALGGALAFGATEHAATGFGQIAGEGWLVPGGRVVDICQRSERLRDLLFRQEQFLLSQAQQTAACNGRHTLPRRVASWLLRARAVVGSDKLGLTQEYLAQMLGVQHASVSGAANIVADSGAIEYRRGRVEIRDADLLGSVACECHRVLAERRERLFGTVAVPATAPA